jgi:hypothetical protein
MLTYIYFNAVSIHFPHNPLTLQETYDFVHVLSFFVHLCYICVNFILLYYSFLLTLYYYIVGYIVLYISLLSVNGYDMHCCNAFYTIYALLIVCLIVYL